MCACGPAQVFSHLTELGPSYETGDDPWFIKKIPFRARDREDQPHPGLRSYPFLGQVCRKWKDLLNTPHAEKVLWEDVVIDFGHELVTAIHTPLIWSNQRPTAEEFASKLAATSLSVDKVNCDAANLQNRVQAPPVRAVSGCCSVRIEHARETAAGSFVPHLPPCITHHAN